MMRRARVWLGASYVGRAVAVHAVAADEVGADAPAMDAVPLAAASRGAACRLRRPRGRRARRRPAAPRAAPLAVACVIAALLLPACGPRGQAEAREGAGGPGAAASPGAVARVEPASAPAVAAPAERGGVAETAASRGPLPGASLYHLDGAWQDALGGELRLGQLRGRPVVLVMFYGNCTSACPLLVHAAQELEATLPAGMTRAGAPAFVMVTIDPGRDTAEALRVYARDKGLDRRGWHFLRGGPLLTRQLAALAGVHYRDAGNGMFSHSNVVTVLDRDGVIAAQVEGLGVPLEPAKRALQALATGD